MDRAEAAQAALLEEVRHEPGLEDELVSAPGAPDLGELGRLALSRKPGQAALRADWLSRSLDERLSRAQAPEDCYVLACRAALVHALLGRREAAFESLRVAASVDDGWARHHHLYGILHAAGGDEAAARFELRLALEREPFASARERLARFLALLDSR